MRVLASKFRTILVIGLYLALAACFGGRPDPAAIKPVYRVLNSPLPVPGVRWNPRRDYARAGAPVRRQTASSAQPRPDRPRPARTQTTDSAPPVATTGTITVRRGDTLYSLARKNGVPLRSLIAANSIRPPYALAVGQKLRLPQALTHTVRRGETGYGISRRYGVNLTALMRLNGIRRPYTLAVGQVLKLPGGAKPAATNTASATPTPTTT